MSTGFQHDRISRFISAIVRAIVAGFKQAMIEAGSATLTLDPKETSAEPDTAFYIRHAKQMMRRDKIDLEKDPPPDLVLEVDITNPTRSKEKIYARIGVPEIWRHNGTSIIIRLLKDGAYHDSPQSLAFPFLTAEKLAEVLETEAEDQTQALSDFADWVNAQAKDQV